VPISFFRPAEVHNNRKAESREFLDVRFRSTCKVPRAKQNPGPDRPPQMKKLLERARAYLAGLEADRQTALALSEQKAEEAKLIKARQEGFQAAHYGTTGVFLFIATAMVSVFIVIASMGPRTTNLRLEAISR
jgi:hypothetical protein